MYLQKEIKSEKNIIPDFLFYWKMGNHNYQVALSERSLIKTFPAYLLYDFNLDRSKKPILNSCRETRVIDPYSGLLDKKLLLLLLQKLSRKYSMPSQTKRPFFCTD